MLTAGCSTLAEGRSQQVSIDTMPEGATCILKSNDDLLGIIQSTPGLIKVEKSKYDIVVECTKPGYIKSKIKNHSDFAVSSLGNLVFLHWGFVGNLVDSATGASNKYDAHMLITMDVDKDSAPAQIAALPPAQATAVQPAALAASQPMPVMRPITAQPAPVSPQPAQQTAALPPAPEPVLDVTKWPTPDSLLESTRRSAGQSALEIAQLPPSP